MKTQDSPATSTAPTGLVPEGHGDRRVTFPVEGGIYGVGRLARRLDALVRTDDIALWRLAGWTDWKHGAIRIDFATPRDARRAAEACRDGAPGGGDGNPERGDGLDAWDHEGGARHTGGKP